MKFKSGINVAYNGNMKIPINNEQYVFSCRQKESGFTLIELFIVLLIIGILVGIATMNTDFKNRSRVTSATRQMLSDLLSARLDGMVSGPSGIAGDPMQNMLGGGIRLISTTQYATFRFNDINPNYQYDGLPEETNTQTFQLQTGVEIKRVVGGALVSPTNSVNDIYMFDHLGLLRDYQWIYNANGSSSSLVIVVQYAPSPSVASNCIFVRANRIREGSWNATTNNCTEK
jgi:prepilin-type N-terminal cleavage/methylation domain-containing protein